MLGLDVTGNSADDFLDFPDNLPDKNGSVFGVGAGICFSYLITPGIQFNVFEFDATVIYRRFDYCRQEI